MKINQFYPSDIRADCRETAAKLNRESDTPRHTRPADVLAVIDILDRLESREGPEKWVRLNHFTTLSFFAFDPGQFARQRPQVRIWCRRRLSELQYLLPSENWPWDYANTVAIELDDAANLILDAFSRCESRREFLIEPHPLERHP